MIKVINISSTTVEIMKVKIKPKKIHMFDKVSAKDRERIASLCAVGKIRAYEIDYVVTPETNNTETTESTPKSRKTNKNNTNSTQTSLVVEDNTANDTTTVSQDTETTTADEDTEKETTPKKK